MKWLFLGDIHGEWKNANKTIRRALERFSDIQAIFQVGDLGDGWPDFRGGELKLHRWEVAPEADGIPIFWCDGNHDNFEAIEKNVFNPRLTYVHRGDILETDCGHRIMFMGGASSIDKDHRTMGIDWWPQEDITYGQVADALNQEGPVDIIISHDRPESFSLPKRMRVFEFGKGNRMALEQLREHFQPKFWFYGHYHMPHFGHFEGCEYTCCPIIDGCPYVVFDPIQNAVWRSWIDGKKRKST